jgi:uncharacterized protein YbjQ (UPF0145 family)
MTSATVKLRLLPGLAALTALGIASTAAFPANAQRAAAEIALVESAAPAGAIVLGEVRAEIHQTSLFARTAARDLADKELRTQAARLGADAVVDIKYESSSPLLSKKGFRAAGKAVRFAPAPVQVSAVAPQPPAPQPAAREQGRLATFEAPAAPAILPPAPVKGTTPAPASSTVAPVATPAPQTTVVTPAPPAPPQAASAAAPAPVAAAAVSVAPRAPAPEALIVLTEGDLTGRAYDRLGEVTAQARQTSLFPKKAARALMDEQLRAQAAKLGADAVIFIKYDSYSPMLSKKGARATGIAVKYR